MNLQQEAEGSDNSKIIAPPKYLWFLILTYTMIIVLANCFTSRPIQIFTLITNAGVIILPLSFLMLSIITEVYGYKYARLAIWYGFLFSSVFIIYSFIITNIPSPLFPTNNNEFNYLLRGNEKIVVASLISYLVSEFLNSYCLAKLKIRTQGHCVTLRFTVSLLLAIVSSSIFFNIIKSYENIANNSLISAIINMCLIKMVIGIVSLTSLIRLADRLKKIEQLDIYDWQTKFNLFSLNIDYLKRDNVLLENSK